MTTAISPRALSTELLTGLAFCTRLPLFGRTPATGGDLARASWSFPVVGAGIGLLAGLIYWISFRLDLSPFVSALLAVATTMLVTGCLHEDGLADTVDGFGGGKTREEKLEIMRDSRVGAYGTCALVFSILFKTGAISSLGDPSLAISALLASHTGGRAILPMFMRRVPTARSDGLAADAGRPPAGTPAIAALIGFAVLLFTLGIGGAVITTVLLAIAAGLLALLCMRQIGGQTGDVLGAVEQTGEILILLVASAWL
ncbi:adenosylcobinamide-GDP ribazoletransferase [Methyloceanibacter sp.]|uniref:adenosylcobinamide-GDP ribazoletransferase n=1 Tax=Methyloceanibacter sp. TaxID=1965321 RepID=UPI002D3BDB1B|nr:adenosylcobinamide-GDP ribazoletransferase [Methyloceanibacter sp.]HZP08021.1 adenosylcobinamide-GDP ribazoletransferase [Methyloceanibacter sp.]